MLARRSLLALAVAAVAAGAALTPAARASGPEVEAFDQAAFDAALAAGAPILVEIFADWCPTCRAQKAALAPMLAEPRFADLRRFEVSFDDSKDVVRAFGATQQSTLIVFAGGAEVARAVGETRPDALAALVAAAY
jgi:thiol-disulfide isomerase/thioredoxin